MMRGHGAAAITVGVLVGLAALAGDGMLWAETTNLPAVADTFIVARYADNNVGAGTHIAAGRDGDTGDGRRRALYRFDLSGVPDGAVVTSATFRTSVIRAALSGAVNSTFALHRITAEWGEGQKGLGPFPQQGLAATGGEVTWNSRRHGSASWSTTGGDFMPHASATRAIAAVGLYTWSGTGLVAGVQLWVDDPAQNFGLLLRSESEGTLKTARLFGSREGGAAAILEVGYTATAPAEIAIVGFEAGRGSVALSWTSNTGQQYDVLYRGRLSGESEWAVAEANIPASASGTNVWTDAPYWAGPASPANSNLFYRIGSRDASPAALPVAFQTVVTGLKAPTVLTHAGDGSGRLFIAEQTGEILIVDNAGNLLQEPFLDVSERMTNLTVFPAFGNTEPGLNPFYDERGLLGLAFHPQHGQNGRFFVYYSSPKTGSGIDHESILAEYAVYGTNANVADPASESVILRVDQPEFNHNAGQLVFGEDGYLYVGLGDGGGAGDAHGLYGNGQNTSNLLGTIVRLDVDSAAPYAVPPDNPFVGMGGRDEIFAYGFRNPYRFSFDRGGTNRLLVADVGQNLWEEINVVTNGGNYGWRVMEGNHVFDFDAAAAAQVDAGSLVFPVHEYKHGPLGISIIGGYTYRGTNYAELAGTYVFGDFSTSFAFPDGKLYYLRETRKGILERFAFRLPGEADLGRFVKGFGEDENGEIYLLSTTNLGPSGTSGDVRRLVRP